jgi:hypothetical protein
MVNVLALASVDGWKITFPESANSVVYAALLLLIGIFLKPTASVPSTVQLDNVPDVGVPRIGVTNVGLVASTTFPDPVEAVVPVPPLATGNVPVTPVVKGKPVALVKVILVGVPKIGVTKVGVVASTFEPVPVFATLTKFLDASVATALEAVKLE